ncbi:hypothetical protein SAMN05421780_11437 [Flexibacter flexilis DSM 6793]|uniref:Secretion system C-terminal sorting domain-containing protein n=1 Tax=Flexibacter flexilis DSM 6793 TaxID=927664 RepID=A0A1I1NPU4_9BACT|nr:T9SS type A sorting domain-containing protein [Flexibacter flexilis]SFC95760.1 hypothetical protein SAMN05421780_11437 [Flexibacter flexilis DSM 6793]
MQKCLLTSLLLLLGYLLPAQNIEWVKPIKKKYLQSAICIAPTQNKGFWIGGDHDDNRTFLAAVDSLGDTLWTKSYRNLHPKGYIKNIFPAPAGQYLVGATLSNYSVGASTYSSATPFLWYVDYTGEIIWESNNLLDTCGHVSINDAIILNNGNIIMVGQFTVLNAFTCSSSKVSFAVCVNPDGLKLWAKQYPQSGATNYITQVLQLPNGHLFCSGAESGHGLMGLEIDQSTGNLIQTRNLLPPALAAINANFYYAYLNQMTDGSLMLSGSYYTNSGTGGSYLAHLSPNFEFLWEKLGNIGANKHTIEMQNQKVLVENAIVTSGQRLNLHLLDIATGDTSWTVTLGQACIPNTQQTACLVGNFFNMNGGAYFDGQGSVYIAGDNTNIVAEDTLYPNGYGQNFYIAKISGVGNPVTNFCQNPPQASFGAAFGNDTLLLQSTSISNITYYDSLGYAWYAGGTYIGSDSLLSYQVTAANYPNGLPIKLVITNHWGCKDSTQAILHPDGTITGNKPNSNRQSTTISNIYPNPAAQSVRLDYSLPSTCQDANLKIYELGTGRILLQKRLSVLERATRVDVSGLPQGLYGCQLYADGMPAPKVQKLSVVR